jgi:hypothetical protein
MSLPAQQVISSPFLAGLPTAPTAPAGDSSQLVANTQFVQNTVATSLSSAIARGLNYSISPGAYINGAAYNGSANVTWNLSATPANVGSTLVARDGSGNIAVGYITSYQPHEFVGRGYGGPQIRMRDASSGIISFYDETDPDNGIYNYSLMMDSGAFSFAYSGANAPYDYGTVKTQFDLNGNIWTAGNLTANGTIVCNNDIWAFASDKRLKENIRPIKDALSKLHQITGILYNFTEEAIKLNPSLEDPTRTHMGIFAQDAQQVAPEVVGPAPFDIDRKTGESISGENYLTVQYDKLIALVIEAVKELDDKVEALDAKIDGIVGAQ